MALAAEALEAVADLAAEAALVAALAVADLVVVVPAVAGKLFKNHFGKHYGILQLRNPSEKTLTQNHSRF
ncbi:hypothetical protein GCM10008083_09490 [Ulvibacter litoralis]|nr:hypothetical protein GCM10008083_09490 [Ulvibacter litoralis]